ncbi:hypothetical protein [Bacillus sp. SA1-12]|nr:hypothetical protein [Bacillus sp. SA1-12]
MESHNRTKKESIDFKKIVERLKKQGIHAQLCKRPAFLDMSSKECMGNP